MIVAFIAVIMVLVACGGIVLFRYGNRIIPIICCSLAVLTLIGFTFITQVPTGFTGVLTTFGKVEDVTLEAGINLKCPWQGIVLMDNREQRSTFNFLAFSSDIQQTNVSGSINYKIDQTAAMNIYRSVGKNYHDILITPRLVENAKVVFSKYTAENLISKRDILADEILNLMKNDLEVYGIQIISISIEDIDFTDAFTNAIEAKQVATQEKLRAETQQQQATMEAAAQAERQKIAANASAEVMRIDADAEAYATSTRAAAEAEANKLINASLTQDLINYVQANNWNGELPNTYMGNSNTPMPIIDIN